MKIEQTYYDVAIVGGGLAGLSAAILLRKHGYRVVLFEKETYPFHKVCGEYISTESWNFLCSLGLPLGDWNLPVITKLTMSAPDGSTLTQPLVPGGFGISRYRIDHALAGIAKAVNVDMHEGTRVNNIVFESDHFVVHSDAVTVHAKACCGAFGKRSNIDVKWQRPFLLQKSAARNNYIGVKYHAHIPAAEKQIALHNFKDGYCGISPVEEDRYCICYLTTAHNLRTQGNNIRQMEKNVLYKNPQLHDILSRTDILYEKPLTISQVSFERKTQVENHVLMLGDAAGLIAPLCGNGMSMALHSSKLATGLIASFLQGEISRDVMEQQYSDLWNKQFARRLKAGRIIQTAMGKEWVTNIVIRSLRHFPKIVDRIISETNGGKPF